MSASGHYRMFGHEVECWSYSLSAWAAFMAWLLVRRLTKSRGYHP